MKNNTAVIDPLNIRLRRSPFWESAHNAGCHSYHVYNRMLIANTTEEDYRHLKSSVQLWDVGCERQVEIKGPDASRLVQASTPRDLQNMKNDQCFYIPTVDGDGNMTNDPVLIKVAENHYWVSVADADLILFYKGVAAALDLKVSIQEPEVSPLGIQGPKADELARRVWGEQVLDIKFFRHARVDVNGTPMLLARSGFGLQGGYELYYEGPSGAEMIWDQLMEAGHDLDVRAACPNQSERIEAGMLAYRIDVTTDMTPFEAGLGHLCEMNRDVGCLGWASLRKKQDPIRQIRPIEISGDTLPRMRGYWDVTNTQGDKVGRISSSCRAWVYDCNAAIGLIDSTHWNPGTELVVEAPDGPREAVIKPRFWGRK